MMRKRNVTSMRPISERTIVFRTAFLNHLHFSELNVLDTGGTNDDQLEQFLKLPESKKLVKQGIKLEASIKVIRDLKVPDSPGTLTSTELRCSYIQTITPLLYLTQLQEICLEYNFPLSAEEVNSRLHIVSFLSQISDPFASVLLVQIIKMVESISKGYTDPADTELLNDAVTVDNNRKIGCDMVLQALVSDESRQNLEVCSIMSV